MQGPQPVKATFESWDASWGDFHYGTGIGSYVCHAGSGFHCGGKNAFSFFVLSTKRMLLKMMIRFLFLFNDQL